jgi:hypothetical protein
MNCDLFCSNPSKCAVFHVQIDTVRHYATPSELPPIGGDVRWDRKVNTLFFHSFLMKVPDF